jgi:hypothetical protein
MPAAATLFRSGCRPVGRGDATGSRRWLVPGTVEISITRLLGNADPITRIRRQFQANWIQQRFGLPPRWCSAACWIRGIANDGTLPRPVFPCTPHVGFNRRDLGRSKGKLKPVADSPRENVISCSPFISPWNCRQPERGQFRCQNLLALPWLHLRDARRR